MASGVQVFVVKSFPPRIVDASFDTLDLLSGVGQDEHVEFAVLVVADAFENTLLGRKLSLNCLFAGRNNNNFDLCRPPGN